MAGFRTGLRRSRGIVDIPPSLKRAAPSGAVFLLLSIPRFIIIRKGGTFATEQPLYVENANGRDRA